MICIGILALIILGIDIYLNDKDDLNELYLWMKRTAGSLKAKLRSQKGKNIDETIRRSAIWQSKLGK